MLLNEFSQAVPTIVRFILFVAITLGITLVAWLIGRKRFRRLMVVPDGANNAQDQFNMTLGVLLTAFAFVAAFMLAQFWSNNTNARQDIYNEQVAVTKVGGLAKLTGSGVPGVEEALKAYATTVQTQEAKAMREADLNGLEVIHQNASATLTQDIAKASKAANVDPTTFSDSLSDVITYGANRQEAMPTSLTPKLFWVIAFLGILSLAFAVILAPENTGAALITLIGLVLGLSFVFFVALEAANPYLTGDLVPLPNLTL